jgi:hypothetical protein
MDLERARSSSIIRDKGIEVRPNLRDRLGLKCWAMRESGLSQKAIAAKRVRKRWAKSTYALVVGVRVITPFPP